MEITNSTKIRVNSTKNIVNFVKNLFVFSMVFPQCKDRKSAQILVEFN